MKKIFVILAMVMVTGCGTVKGTAGGFLEGAGQDLSRAGEWVKGQ